MNRLQLFHDTQAPTLPIASRPVNLQSYNSQLYKGLPTSQYFKTFLSYSTQLAASLGEYARQEFTGEGVESIRVKEFCSNGNLDRWKPFRAGLTNKAPGGHSVNISHITMSDINCRHKPLRLTMAKLQLGCGVTEIAEDISTAPSPLQNSQKYDFALMTYGLDAVLNTKCYFKSDKNYFAVQVVPGESQYKEIAESAMQHPGAFKETPAKHLKYFTIIHQPISIQDIPYRDFVEDRYGGIEKGYFHVPLEACRTVLDILENQVSPNGIFVSCDAGFSSDAYLTQSPYQRIGSRSFHPLERVDDFMFLKHILETETGSNAQVDVLPLHKFVDKYDRVKSRTSVYEYVGMMAEDPVAPHGVLMVKKTPPSQAA